VLASVAAVVTAVGALWGVVATRDDGEPDAAAAASSTPGLPAGDLPVQGSGDVGAAHVAISKDGPPTASIAGAPRAVWASFTFDAPPEPGRRITVRWVGPRGGRRMRAPPVQWPHVVRTGR
jgi:hypothetical protein